MKTVTLLRPDGFDDIHAVVIARLEEWYFIREIRDFHFDSYSLVASDTVERVRFNRFDKKLTEVFYRHGEPDQEEPPISPNFDDDDETLVQAVADLGRLVIVENEEPGEARFMIGSVHRITRGRLYMKHFGADGKWSKRPVGIDFWEISRFAFGGEYETAWAEYFDGQPKA